MAWLGTPPTESVVTNLQKQEIRWSVLVMTPAGGSAYIFLKRYDIITSYEKRGMNYTTAAAALPTTGGSGTPIITDSSAFPIGGGGYNIRWTEYVQGTTTFVGL